MSISTVVDDITVISKKCAMFGVKGCSDIVNHSAATIQVDKNNTSGK